MAAFLYLFCFFLGWQVGLFWAAYRLAARMKMQVNVGVLPGLLGFAFLAVWAVT